MKLKDLLMMDFVNDDTIFITSRPISGSVCDIRKGKWFNDNILDFMSLDVKKFDYDFELNYLTVALQIPIEEDAE